MCGRSLLISGIPSVRRDAIGTAIRYTLVVDDVERALARSLAAAGLDRAGRARLGGLLDAGFPADWVDAALGDTAPSDADVAHRLAPALAAFGDDEPAVAHHPVRHRSWVGALDDGAGRGGLPGPGHAPRRRRAGMGVHHVRDRQREGRGRRRGRARRAGRRAARRRRPDGGRRPGKSAGRAATARHPDPDDDRDHDPDPSRRRWLVPLAGLVLLVAILAVVLITTVIPL